ncbi:ParA family partition ATPase [uncultured Thiodictyon sp.]|uniref:ParA family partition ATPase n=1 Tax=uncultured Thiodictyon sp. TaxID=1846217 RepID=UPI0025D11DA4|nr:ParA family partition ATPase [uncultured Thiodictyon sp.]
MTAKIVTVTNQKGGCGKTTVSMQLAGGLAKHGRVLVVDADAQATATRWAASASDDQPFPATVTGLAAAGAKLHREVRKYLTDYDFILIDCPPSVESPVPQSALLVSDLALIPIIPAPADLWAASGTRVLIEQAGALNNGLIARMVPNMVPRTSLGDEVLGELSGYGIPLTQAQLRQRTAYREAQVYGTTVHTMGARARDSIEEVDLLLEEILGILSGVAR